jgi:PAS domain S-box-containing protein
MGATPADGRVSVAVGDVVFRRIYEKSGLGYGLVGPDLRFMDVNPALCDMLGYERDELVGRTYAEVTHPDDVAVDVELGEKVFAGEIPGYSLQKRFLTKGGELRHVELYASVVIDPESDRPYGVAIVEDITERWRADENRRLLRAILVAANEAPSPGWAFEATLELVCRHLGWQVGHAYLLNGLGQLESTRVWYLDGGGLDGRLEPFRQTSEGQRWEPGQGLPGKVLEVKRPVWVADVTIWPAFERDAAFGMRAGLAVPVLIGQDVVAVLEFFSVEHEEPDADLLEVMEDVGVQLGRVVERRRATDAIERLVGERMAFIDRAAHELRSHTAPIGHLVSILARQNDGLDRDLAAETVQTLQTAVDHLRDLVSRLLDLSAMQEGRPVLQIERVSVSELVRAAIGLAVDSGQAVVAVDVEPGLSVMTDPLMLERIVVNLVTNAHLHGGPRVTVAAWDHEGSVVIEVADDGPGVDPELVEQVFEPFVRGATDATGTGLGLAICRGLALALGATLEYAPNRPRGARFVLTHPAVVGA